jgi:hypothetical protein
MKRASIKEPNAGKSARSREWMRLTSRQKGADIVVPTHELDIAQSLALMLSRIADINGNL